MAIETDPHDPMLMGGPMKTWQILTLVGVILKLITSIFLLPARKENTEIPLLLQETITLNVSSSTFIGKTYMSSNSAHMTYRGMPSTNTYSLSHGNRANTYYPTSLTTVNFYGYEIEIIKIRPDYLKFRVKGKIK